MLENEPYKNDMEDLEAYRLWIQSFSFPAMEAIDKIYSGKTLRGGETGPSNEQLQEFSNIVSEEVQFRYDRKPSFNRGGEFNNLSDIVGNTSIVSDFETALKAVAKLGEDPENFDQKEMVALAKKFYDAYKDLADGFPATYRDGVKAISEKSEEGDKDDFARLKKSIVREIAIEKLSPRSLRGSEKYPSQILKQRAKATANLSTTTLDESSIIESVLGKDEGGPVKSEEAIKSDIDKAKKAWEKVAPDEIKYKVSRLLEEGDFLVSEAHVVALKGKTNIKKAYKKYRDAIAADILTEYPEREALRARLEQSEMGMKKKTEADKLLDTLKKKSDLSDEEKSELAQLKEGIHPLQEESARLLSGTKKAGSIARARARQERNEKKRRYSVKVDEIVRQTNFEVDAASQAKIEAAEKTLKEKIIGETASSGSSMLRPTAKVDGNQTIVRSLASVANAKLLSDRNLSTKVTSAILSVDSEQLLNFLDSSPDCFSGVDMRDTHRTILKAFVSSFKKIGRFYDSGTNTTYSPSYDSPFEDSSAGRITNYAKDFVSYICACCSIEVAEQTIRNFYTIFEDEMYFNEEAGVWVLYKSLGFYEEAKDFVSTNFYDMNLITEGDIKRMSEELRDHIVETLKNNLASSSFRELT
jgi:hypothetical protein